MYRLRPVFACSKLCVNAKPKPMFSQRWHRYLGYVLVVPLLLWAATGAVFLFKPGYAGAYEQLSVHSSGQHCKGVEPQLGPWQELRLISSVLGCHQLQKLQGTWQHLQANGEPWLPIEAEIRRLLGNVTAHNPERYGRLASLNQIDNRWIATTTTEVEITLNWADLSLRQQGRDSRLINTLYKIHYLQPFGVKWLNQAFASLILVLLTLSVLLGVRLLFKKR